MRYDAMRCDVAQIEKDYLGGQVPEERKERRDRGSQWLASRHRSACLARLIEHNGMRRQSRLVADNRTRSSSRNLRS